MLYALFSLFVLLIALPIVYWMAVLFWALMLWIGNRLLELYVKIKCRLMNKGGK